MPREFPRSRRVADQLQRELADLIRREIRDPRAGSVTITGVDVSRDLGHAKVFISVLQTDHDVDEAVRVLTRAAGFLRHELGRRLRIRMVPELRFIHDRSLEQGAHLSRLIDETVKGRGNAD